MKERLVKDAEHEQEVKQAAARLKDALTDAERLRSHLREIGISSLVMFVVFFSPELCPSLFCFVIHFHNS
jgi:hypothetical protein